MLDRPFVEILATWGMVGAVCYGIGAWILRAGGVSHRIGNAVVTMVVGWSARMAAAQISRFFVAATSWGLLVAAAAAVPGYVWTRWNARPTWRHAAIAVAWVGAGAWCAALSLRAVPNYDTGLYHYDMVRWAQTYPLVPGLANVHDRLGINSTIFVFAAMVDHAPFGLAAHVVLSGFFAWLWAGWVAIEALRSPNQDEPGIRRVFAIASLPVLVEWAAGNQLPSLGPDIAVACFVLIVTGECLPVMQSGRFLKERVTVLAVMVCVAAAAVTVKLSALGLLGGVGLVFVGHAIAAERRGGRSVRTLFQDAGRPAWVFTGVAAVNLGAWVGGNLILSGYPVYPSVIGGLPVSWAVPPQLVEAFAAWVRSSAHMPGKPFYLSCPRATPHVQFHPSGLRCRLSGWLALHAHPRTARRGSSHLPVHGRVTPPTDPAGDPTV